MHALGQASAKKSEWQKQKNNCTCEYAQTIGVEIKEDQKARTFLPTFDVMDML
jgi:hypothetical protein